LVYVKNGITILSLRKLARGYVVRNFTTRHPIASSIAGISALQKCPTI
jgi:hypothetical protein